jgi:IS30 family transposase
MSKSTCKIDWEKVDEYLKAGCSGIEIAAHLGIHKDTLYNNCRRDKGVTNWEDYAREKKSSGNLLIRLKKFELVMAGDKTMLIWESKQRLGESEKVYSETKTQVSQILPDKISEAEAQDAASAYNQLLNCQTLVNNNDDKID